MTHDEAVILARIDERLKGLEEDFKNYLMHHWDMTLGAWAAALGAFSTLVVFMVTH